MSQSISQVFALALAEVIPDDDLGPLLELEFLKFGHGDEEGAHFLQSVDPHSAEIYERRVLYFQQKQETVSPFDLNQLLLKSVMDDKLLNAAILIRLGAEIETRERQNRGLFHYVTSPDMVELLLRYGANLFHRCDAGNSPLHYVSTPETCECLVANGISVNARNNGGNTPLHYANRPSIARALLSLGANPNLISNSGHSPLHLISSNGLWEVVWFLLGSGILLHFRGSDGQTALQQATVVYNQVLVPTVERSLRKLRENSSSSIPQEAKRLLSEKVRMEKTLDLLQFWEHEIRVAIEEGLLPDVDHQVDEEEEEEGHIQTLPSPILDRIWLRASNHLSWKTLELVCKHPREALSASTGLPEALIDKIVVEYLGPFREGQDQKGRTQTSMASMRRTADGVETPRASSSSSSGFSSSEYTNTMMLVGVSGLCLVLLLVFLLVRRAGEEGGKQEEL